MEVASRAIGLETQRRHRVEKEEEGGRRKKKEEEARRRRRRRKKKKDEEEVHVYLIFHLLPLYVLLDALQEVIGVKVSMSWSMSGKRQRVEDVMEKSGMQLYPPPAPNRREAKRIANPFVNLDLILPQSLKIELGAEGTPCRNRSQIRFDCSCPPQANRKLTCHVIN